MRVWLAFLLLLIPFASSAQPKRMHYLTNDSLPRKIAYGWAFHQGDSAQWASADYNDSLWELTGAALYYQLNPKKPSDTFSSMGWLRYTLFIDSSLLIQPLAYTLTHYGASEVYIDGKLTSSAGYISTPDSIIYEDPQNQPVTFVLSTPGRHVIAVRYANYAAAHTFNVYGRQFAGFHMTVDKANSTIERYFVSVHGISLATLFMFGVLIALCFIHLFLFLYYRQARSNLYFSIFCLSLSLIFLLTYLNRFSNSPSVQHNSVFISVLIASAACFSLSGFSNFLFADGRRRRFRNISILCLIIPILFFVDVESMMVGYLVLIGITSLETIILIFRAIYRRTPGARILAFGVGSFAMFFLVCTGVLLYQQSIELNDSSATAQVVEAIGILTILSVPVSISLYLAWSYAHTSKNLAVQLQQVQTLSEKTLQQELEKQRLLESRKEELETEVAARTADLVAEKKKSDDLLMNILPGEVAEELKHSGSSSARFFDNVTVLFSDFVNFTTASERMSPQELVNELHACFKAFDEIISRHNIEKIKTIGDAYLAVSGLPAAQQDHARNVARAALEMRSYMVQRKAQLGDKTFDIRIGLHSGSVVAGIVGVKKFAYDIWGDTVNTAARMEQNSEPGKINVSQATYQLIKDHFACTYRGEIHAKNKGEMKMYFVEAPLPPKGEPTI